jgi:hypothetical protein
VFPGWNKYASANWDERECTAGELGEQPGARPWSDGKPAGRPIGNLEGCSPLSWWERGLGPTEIGNFTYPACYPTCCEGDTREYWGGSPVPDRILVQWASSGAPFCPLVLYPRIMHRIEGRSEWAFEFYGADLCYVFMILYLQRIGPLDTDWAFSVYLSAPLINIYPNFGTLVSFTKVPFRMQFLFFPFTGPYWTAPVLATLTQ